MDNFFYLAYHLIFLFGILFLFFFMIFSVLEKEHLAVKRTIYPIFLFIFLLGIHYFGFVPYSIQYFTVFAFFIFLLLLFIPFRNKNITFNTPDNQFDERDIMFSRMELQEGTEKFDEYYQKHPENKQKDDLFRSEPGLLNENSKYYHPFLFNAARATFSTVDLLQPLVEGFAQNKPELKAEVNETTNFIKTWAKKLGAMDVGITLLKPYHVYSHKGRGEKYGDKVDLKHKYAIAFTVEMEHETMSFNPQGPVIMESAQQYLNAGTIAVQLAQFIRNLGFDARAHIDANYSVICPIVAQDAGLGVIGRLGLLITPKLGPRVRIGVVTTDLELTIHAKSTDSTVIHFCEICKKCAVNCPSKSISFQSSKIGNERHRWRINQESCFTYWTKVGTDCGRCVAVCPYSHPDNILHNLIRWLIRRNSFNRWLVIKLDKYFYSNKPPVNTLKF